MSVRSHLKACCVLQCLFLFPGRLSRFKHKGLSQSRSHRVRDLTLGIKIAEFFFFFGIHNDAPLRVTPLWRMDFLFSYRFGPFDPVGARVTCVCLLKATSGAIMMQSHKSIAPQLRSCVKGTGNAQVGLLSSPHPPTLFNETVHFCD